jgi:hypothetical protein
MRVLAVPEQPSSKPRRFTSRGCFVVDRLDGHVHKVVGRHRRVEHLFFERVE